MSHTPGPWKARRNAAFWEVNCLRDGETEFNDCSPCVAHAWGIGDEDAADGPTSAANAALIAAAPELLRALEEIMGKAEGWLNMNLPDEVGDKARAALLKARAQP